MSGEAKREPIEVYLVEPGQGRPPFTFEGALEYLPADAPLPAVGDVILLPRHVTGDSKAQTFAWGGTLAPFRVIEREHVYYRDARKRFNRAEQKPARYVRTLLSVRRMSEAEYHADPGC